MHWRNQAGRVVCKNALLLREITFDFLAKIYTLQWSVSGPSQTPIVTSYPFKGAHGQRKTDKILGNPSVNSWLIVYVWE
jgi:hypothetical protein